MPVIPGETYAGYLADAKALIDTAYQLKQQHMESTPVVTALQQRLLPAGATAEGVKALLGDEYADNILRVLFDRTVEKDVDCLKETFCDLKVRMGACVKLLVTIGAYSAPTVTVVASSRAAVASCIRSKLQNVCLHVVELPKHGS